MKCLIITHDTGVSFQFDDQIKKGLVRLFFEESGLNLSFSFANTDFVIVPTSCFRNRGNIELKVISNKTTIAKKRITNN